VRVLSLFAGIGGMDIGLERAGMTVVAQCEIDPFCRAVLKKHWKVPIYEDVRELTASVLERDGIACDLLAAGFPCQDVSRAGSKAGIEGGRTGLWREVARLVGELGPRWCLLENVEGLLDGEGMARVLGDLATLGYDADWGCVDASYVGAPHKRSRVFIVAYPAGVGQQEPRHAWAHACREPPRSPWKATDAVDALRRGTVPVLCREHDGVSRRLERLTALGNAVVPAAAELVGRAIIQAEAA
jgi:DNA (cytosine-5)-methyltransferase 1